MRNLLTIVLIVIIIFLISFLYRSHTERIYDYFPLNDENKSARASIYIYIFFSKQNCQDCLEVIQYLNELSSEFKVLGVVPDKELQNEKELRQVTGAMFPLFNASNFKRYLPTYAPTLIGVSQNGEIFFILPSIPGNKQYFKEFLTTFYSKAYPLLIPR